MAFPSSTLLFAASRRALLISAASVWLAFPASSPAQYGAPPSAPPPSMGDRPSQQQQASAPTPMAEVWRAAACVAAREPVEAGEILATVPYSRQERQKALGLLRSAQRCIRSREAITTSPTMLRGAVAEALYEGQFAAPQPVRAPAVLVSPSRLDASAPETAAQLAPAFALAECSVAAQPETIRNVLTTEVGSEAELAALRGLNPVFAGCITQGTSLNADRGTLRALLADSLYRWSVVQRDGSASAWAAPPAAPAAN